MLVPTWVWLATLAAIAAMLAVDLLAHRGARYGSMRVAAAWSAAWVGLGVVFGLVVWAAWGAERAGEYFGGYLLEKSLSVDNVAVLALIFTSFAVPPAYPHRVLFFGVVGALAMRGALIAAGVALITRFNWILYVFGGFLLVTAWRMLRVHRPGGPGGGLIMRMIPAVNEYHGARFLTRRAGRLRATPLLVVLVLVEVSDLVFAVDSIPAVLSVTREPFLVFTSNAFAILGLRALYSLLDGLLHRFVYLRPALAVILAFAGLKMVLADVVHIPVALSLAIIVACLGIAVLASAFASSPASSRGGSIGIDDELPGRQAVAVTGEQERAERFAEHFRAVYLTFHRRDRPRSELPGASRAVLEHLALAGPLTVGEAATHMRRAQSVISEIVTHLERDGLLERENDPEDRRRTLIWLTPAGQEALRRDRDVLGVDLLARAMARLPPGQADALNAGMRALIDCAHLTEGENHDV